MAYKTFIAGEEALASDVNGLLMSQTVARFTSAAQRTSQLAAPVLNQLSVLDSRPGVVQYWNGSAWTDAYPFAQSGYFNGTTSAGSEVALTYPVQFATGTVVPLITNMSVNTASIVFIVLSSTTAGCTVRCYVGPDLQGYANSSVQFAWIAFGARP
jgi:hypothetical protein